MKFILTTVDHSTMSIAMAAVRFKADNLITKRIEGHGDIWLTLVRMGLIIDLVIFFLGAPKDPIIFYQHWFQSGMKETFLEVLYKTSKNPKFIIYIINSPILSI